jgi:tRNA nucleotidyltransferase (CCA-adding enzyme)
VKIYLVGGAVRDHLLGRPITERDWVVVGATIDEMIAQGFKPVGHSFPVFLHPKTHEEYALARTEKKVSKGYKGFTFYTSPDITLEEDLKRRDLTINAMAEDEEGCIIDPFQGQVDLKHKKLRHVSDAFAEDPVRILRVARLAAGLEDFIVASETNELMRSIVVSGEANALVSERVAQELLKALALPYPWRFFEVLQACEALAVIFPEIYVLFGIPNPLNYHPEIDTGQHTLLALRQAAKLSKGDALVGFAVLMHDVGKAMTKPSEWPSHVGHERGGLPIIKKFCQRLNMPRAYRDLALLVARYHTLCHKSFELRANKLVKLMKRLDVYRRPERFEKFLLACQADLQGRQGHETDACPQIDFLREVSRVCVSIRFDQTGEGLSQEHISQHLHQQRVMAVKRLK